MDRAPQQDSSANAVERRTVALVVVTYRSTPLLADFFNALPAALTGVSEYEVVVVDNASDDQTVQTVRAIAPTATIVALTTNNGYAAGVNAGIAAATNADAVLILNPDIRLGPGSVSALLETLNRPGVGIAVPRLRDQAGSLQHSLHRPPSVLRAWGEAILGGRRAGAIPSLGETIVDDSAYSQETVAAWASGAAMAVSRLCLQATGPWNEAFFLYSEETDFCLRARDVGFVVQLQPRAEAVHIGGEMATSSRLWAMQVWNRVRLFRARHGHVAAALFRAGVVMNETLRAIAGRSVHRAGTAAVLFASCRPPEVAGDLPAIDKLRRPPGYVCFSAQDFWYHNRAHSDIQLMRNVAITRPVLFVNSIGMRMPLPGRSTKAFRRIWRKAKSMSKFVRQPFAEVPNFRVMTPVTIPLYGSRLARWLSAALVRMQVRVAARMLGIETASYVVTIPTAWDVVRKIRHRYLVYNRSDLHSSFPEADKALIEGYEAALLSHADLVCYVSHALLEAERHLTGERAFFLDHGVDLEHFRAIPAHDQPAEVRNLAHPRIGFFGGLDDYIIDFDLLEQIATELPEASLILVGDATCSMQRFEKLTNVHWLGFRPYEQIPAYGSSFDVAIMPWLDNAWIRHSNPIKLKEYLSLGLPVVTTDFPEAHYYSPNVTIARRGSEFVTALRKAIASPPDKAFQRAVVTNKSWLHHAEILVNLCEARQQPARLEN